MRFCLVARRTIWFPTLLGWCLLLLAGSGSFALWWFYGEAFLGVTQRCPANVLVVEGWIGPQGVQAAVSELRQGHYEWVVATGGLSGEPWDAERWNYAKEAEKLLRYFGIPANRILVASTPGSEAKRTYAGAVAVRQSLLGIGVGIKGINVFTEGDHARRSRLIYGKVFGHAVPVGVVSWRPRGYDAIRWWQSSDRAIAFLKETVAYPFEKLLDSGRKAAAAP